MKRTAFIILLILCAAAKSSAQEKLTHFEVYGGYECFPDMTNKSGWSINAGAGYAFTQKYYMAAMLHCGINNGKFTGMYAGEKTRLSHNLREYMIGIGPGVYLYNGGDKWTPMCCLATDSEKRQKTAPTRPKENRSTVLQQP